MLKNKFVFYKTYLTANWKTLFLGLVWVGFIILFTYTSLLVELTKIEGDFLNLFYNEQSKYISLFVNIGIVIMLMFDNLSSGKYNNESAYVSIFAIVLCIIVMAHCDLNINNKLQNFKVPLSCKKLSIGIHILFLLLVYRLKVKTLTEEIISTKKEVVWKQ